MDNSQAPASILDTLRTVEFRLGLKGYNVDEVDEYLDKAAQEAEGLQEHIRQLNERLRQASERIAQLERDRRAAPVAAEVDEGAAAAAAAATAETDETLQRTLLLAQKFVDQTKRESEAEAAAIVAQAEESARTAIAAAEATAAQLQAETHQKLREEVSRLESTRTELATDVESMARHLEAERNRLRGALSEILKWVDENVQPANSLLGVKPKTPAGNGEGGAGEPAAASSAGLSEADDGVQTLNLQSASGGAVSGVPRSV
jgi:cell division initiation protein